MRSSFSGFERPKPDGGGRKPASALGYRRPLSPFQFSGNPVAGFVTDKDGNMYIATQNGLLKYDKFGNLVWSVTTYGAFLYSGTWVQNLCIDQAKGILFMGCSDGKIRGFSCASGAVVFTSSTTFSTGSNGPCVVECDQDGSLYAGTYGSSSGGIVYLFNPYVRNDAVTQYNAAPGYNVTQIQLTNERVYILTSDSIMRCVTKSLAGPVGVYNSFSVFGICAISENEVYVATYYSPSYTLRRLAYNGSTAFGNVWVLSSLPANSCSYVWKTSKALYFCGLTSTGWYKVIGDGAGFDLVYPLSANYVSPVVINDKFAIVNNTTTGGSNFLTVYDESL